MKKMLVIFVVFILSYHLLHTFFVYGVDLLSPQYFSALKDLFWIILAVLILLFHRSVAKQFFVQRKIPLLLLLVLSLGAVSLSLLQGQAVGSIVVGFKYDIYPLWVLLSAIGVGAVYASVYPSVSSDGKCARYIQLIFTLLIIGLIRQVLKIFLPDLLHLFGYGPVGDYLLGQAPPLYYRTGPGGMMRLQGLFAGPNNYGFLLVGLTGVIMHNIFSAKRSKEKIFGLLLFFGSLFRTLSRGAWVGAFVVLGLTIWYYFPRYKKALIAFGIAGICSVLAVSFLKSGSTSGHLSSLKEGLNAVVAQPSGYGLGMAGPSIHYAGVYLPENQYLQIVLDIGVIGCLLRFAVWLLILAQASLVVRDSSSSSAEQKLLLRLLLFGIVGLSVEGLFLHVWEDSIVNYLILISFGMLLGILKNQRIR